MVKGGDPRFIPQNQGRKGEEVMNEGKENTEVRYVPKDAVLKKDERGWVPLSNTERDGRGWNLEDEWKRVERGEMKFAYATATTVVFFERVGDREKYKHLRKRGDWVYEDKERYLAEQAGIPYWCDVEREEEQRKRESEEKECWLETAFTGLFGIVCGLLKLVWNVVAVICCILFLRNLTQWFLGTGDYGKRCECE